MRRLILPIWAALMMVSWLSDPALAQGEKRTADVILKDLEAAKLPEIPADRQNRDAVQEYIKKRTEVAQKRSELALELYKAAPDSPEIAKLMSERWMAIPPFGPQAEVMTKEIEEVLSGSKNEALRTEHDGG